MHEGVACSTVDKCLHWKLDTTDTHLQPIKAHWRSLITQNWLHVGEGVWVKLVLPVRSLAAPDFFFSSDTKHTIVNKNFIYLSNKYQNLQYWCLDLPTENKCTHTWLSTTQTASTHTVCSPRYSRAHPHCIASSFWVNSNMEESFGNLRGTHFYFLAERVCLLGDG